MHSITYSDGLHMIDEIVQMASKSDSIPLPLPTILRQR